MLRLKVFELIIQGSELNRLFWKSWVYVDGSPLEYEVFHPENVKA